MKISVIGAGYVGLVTGTCFAELGNSVILNEIDDKKLKMLKKGLSPIYEPGLEELLKRNIKEKRLFFSKDIVTSTKKSDIIFIAVGTPPSKTGEADLSFLIKAVKQLSKGINGYKIIVNKSTVPVGTGDIVSHTLVGCKISKKRFDVVSNPEFLREGNAITDFMRPDRIVIGARNNKIGGIISTLYRPLNAPILITDIESAEMIKYASNAFLATKISFINEIANICNAVNADIRQVTRGISLDTRIGDKFLEAGIGYGGSCFPKDSIALVKIAEKAGYDFRILKKVIEVNDNQRKLFVRKLKKALKSLKGKTISVLGLSFKPNTDDMREAPSITVIKAIVKSGAKVRAYDPIAGENARKILGTKKITYCETIFEAVKSADALLILTDWNEFKQMDLRKVKGLMRSPLIIDGRNMYISSKMKELGFKYYNFGMK